MNHEQLLEIAIRDLVKLAIISHNVILQGSFPGIIADEVKNVLDLTLHIKNTFTKEVNSDQAE
jgi:hypothetical protein